MAVQPDAPRRAGLANHAGPRRADRGPAGAVALPQRQRRVRRRPVVDDRGDELPGGRGITAGARRSGRRRGVVADGGRAADRPQAAIATREQRRASRRHLEHALDRLERAHADGLGHVDLRLQIAQRTGRASRACCFRMYGHTLHAQLSSSGGAGISVLPGAAFCILCRMPASVATMNACLGLTCARSRSGRSSTRCACAWRRMPSWHSGCAITSASGCCGHQLEQAPLAERLVDDAGALPRHEVGAVAPASATNAPRCRSGANTIF